MLLTKSDGQNNGWNADLQEKVHIDQQKNSVNAQTCLALGKNKIILLINSYQYATALMLTLKALITTAADNIFIFFHCSEKIRLDISDDSYEMPSLIFSEKKTKQKKNKKKTLDCSLLML